MTAEDPSGYEYTVNDCILNFVCLFAFQEEVSFDDFVEETTFSRIIGSGEFWCLDPLCIAVEGEEPITLGARSSWDFFFLSIMYLALTIQPRPVMFTFFVKC